MVAPAVAAAPPVRAVAAPPAPSTASVLAPKADEIEAQFVAFVDAYNRGRLDAMAALFDDDAQTSQRQGRAAIRREYDDLFRRSDWRRMNVSRMSWKLLGDVAQVRAEGAVRTAWRDGREAEERLALDMDLARRDGRVAIIRLSQQAAAP
jgi:ketosteroid isomerase-like protein